jgi:hypothetical protein
MMLYRQIEWSLVSCMGLVRRDHGVTTLSVYTSRWFLLTNSVHETNMASSHQCHAQDQWALYLCILHRGLFSPIPYMRSWTTLSVYTTPWSLLTNPIHENRSHSICLYNIMVSSHQSHTWEQWDWWEETMMLYRQIEWSLVSCMELVRRDHGVV